MEFRIRWESDSKDKEKIYVAGTKKDAEDMFLRDQDPRTESLIIECDEGIFNAESDLQKELRLKADRREKKGLELKKQKEAEKVFLNNLIQKIKSEGFQKLNSQEVEAVGEVLDEVLTAKTESQEKLDLVRVTLMDEQAYKFYTLRSNTRSSLQQEAMLKAMNVNLSDISNKTGGIKTASMFTGMAAARHLGEEIAEDFGGGDE